MQVTTAPVRNAVGEVTGGVEMFPDVSSMQVDLQKANQSKPRSLGQDRPDDPLVAAFEVLDSICGIITFRNFRSTPYFIAFRKIR
jgi:hypothetical protein